MKRVCTVLALMGACILLTTPAGADWKEGDPFKMHHPQLPDLNGWDVNIVAPNRVADDFKCTQTGPITGIHLWFSLQEGNSQILFNVESLRLSIHADKPDPDGTGPLYSMPVDGDPLWTREFMAGENGDLDDPIPWPETGDQGWADPVNGLWIPDDHQGILQANVLIDPDSAFQQKGTLDEPIVYWLEASVKMADGTDTGVGWKTTTDRYAWNDDAVYWDDTTVGITPGWQELWENGEPGVRSLNMAFVITPEPGTVAMLIGAGLIGLVAFARRRRKS